MKPQIMLIEKRCAINLLSDHIHNLCLENENQEKNIHKLYHFTQFCLLGQITLFKKMTRYFTQTFPFTHISIRKLYIWISTKYLLHLHSVPNLKMKSFLQLQRFQNQFFHIYWSHQIADIQPRPELMPLVNSVLLSGWQMIYILFSLHVLNNHDQGCTILHFSADANSRLFIMTSANTLGFLVQCVILTANG